jgi:hypothetical protein
MLGGLMKVVRVWDLEFEFEDYYDVSVSNDEVSVYRYGDYIKIPVLKVRRCKSPRGLKAIIMSISRLLQRTMKT